MTSESQTQTRFVELVFPENTNHYRTLFAGNGLSMMAKAAFITATRFARQRFVLARSDNIDFKAPAHEGELLEIIAEVTEVKERSLVITGELWAEDLLSGQRRLCISGTFIAKPVDEQGRAIAVEIST